jgi:hypothetical protein
MHAANCKTPNVALERELLKLRAALFANRPRETPPPFSTSGWASEGANFGVPSVAADELDVTCLRACIGSHGSLQVRGFLGSQQVEELRASIDAALAAQQSSWAGAETASTLPWFESAELTTGAGKAKRWPGSPDACLAANSPRGLFRVLETMYSVGLDSLVTEYLGERPVLSVQKTTLRRVVPESFPGGWHQDGQFLGTGIRSLNVWIALSDCGSEAPGLDVLPTRLQRILEVGTEGAEIPFCVSPLVVEREFPARRLQPEFQAGDALIFDHFLLYRSQSSFRLRTVSQSAEVICIIVQHE